MHHNSPLAATKKKPELVKLEDIIIFGPILSFIIISRVAQKKSPEMISVLFKFSLMDVCFSIYDYFRFEDLLA